MSADPTTRVESSTPTARVEPTAPTGQGTGVPSTTDAAGRTEASAAEVSAAEVSATEVSATEVSAAEVSATEVSATEVSATEAPAAGAVGGVSIRMARTSDVRDIRSLVDTYAPDRRLLSKATVTLYEDVPDFLVAELDGRVVACGAVHVIWEDLAEVRTVAVDPALRGRGIGAALLDRLVARARDLGVQKVFCLTFETAFFATRGFVEIEGTPVDHDVYEQLLQSYDEGVAEFLDLERVKPNTLGNHRMLLHL